MGILDKVDAALQHLFVESAEQAALDSGVIQRKRKFTPLSLARTFVLGFLQSPNASDEQLAQMAGQCGADVTPQAVEQRQTMRLVNFLEKLFRYATQQVVGSDQALAPLLERFTRVTILDSSTITLPDEMRDRFCGCGGSYDSGVSVMKLQTEFDLRSGALTHVEIEDGRSPDAATSRQEARQGSGSLRITDLGYFALVVFAAMQSAGEYFLSRLQFGTRAFLSTGEGIGLREELLNWLAKQPGPFVDVSVLLGREQRLPCRLIAWRLPRDQAECRRRKLRKHTKKKKKRVPSEARLAWCDWTILVTNVPGNLLTPPEAAVLYRARWQVELLFKRWKSLGLVAELSGSKVERQMVRVWSRLLAAVVQHWLMVGTIWGDPTRSLVKVWQGIRGFVSRIAAALCGGASELGRVLADMRATFAKTCRLDKRSDPGTFELLNNVCLLNYELT